MESLTSGTIAGSGSFRCRRCGYVLTLTGSDRLSDCPGCGGRDFVRASLFSAGSLARSRATVADVGHAPGDPVAPLARHEPIDDHEWLVQARERITEPGEYLAYEDSHEVRLIPLSREWTRIGRSLAADVRFDDPTVSRRHALVVRQPDGVRVLDDRSLNGVFVNGRRTESSVLVDGDEILVGRYRLRFLSAPPESDDRPAPSTLHRAG